MESFDVEKKFFENLCHYMGFSNVGNMSTDDKFVRARKAIEAVRKIGGSTLDFCLDPSSYEDEMKFERNLKNFKEICSDVIRNEIPKNDSSPGWFWMNGFVSAVTKTRQDYFTWQFDHSKSRTKIEDVRTMGMLDAVDNKKHSVASYSPMGSVEDEKKFVSSSVPKYMFYDYEKENKTAISKAISEILGDSATFVDCHWGFSRDASSMPDWYPMKKSDLDVERKLREGTATWKDAFLHSSENGPCDAVLHQRWNTMLENSRAERFAAGMFTYREAMAISDRLFNESERFLSERTSLRKDDLVSAFRDLVKGLRGGPDEFKLDGRYPNLMVLVGNARVVSPDAGNKLRWVGGNLSVDVPTVMDNLNEVKGSMDVNDFFKANNLSKVGKHLNVFSEFLQCRNLLNVGGMINCMGEIKGHLESDTRKALRRAGSRNIFRTLSRNEKEGLGMNRSPLGGLKK